VAARLQLDTQERDINRAIIARQSTLQYTTDAARTRPRTGFLHNHSGVYVRETLTSFATLIPLGNIASHQGVCQHQRRNTNH
jgi:hypothetical protein